VALTIRTVVRDPVHGDIGLTREELAILDTPEMQRLRGVRQLGTAYLVYPGAQHSRFEHSLGTMHLVQAMTDAINRNRALAPGELIGIADDELRILRAAALVHDLTHIPFGHGIEDASGILARHDSAPRYAAALAPHTAVGAALERMGIRREVLATLVPERAAPAAPEGSRSDAALAQGQLALAAAVPEIAAADDDSHPELRGLPQVPPYWRQILSDTICADILDYLKRDALFTGLNLRYDDRVIQFFMVERASGLLFVDAAKRGLLREDVISELVRVLDARYFFSERVYYHHAKVAASAMVSMVVQTALLQGGLAPEALYDKTDESLWSALEAHPPSYPEAARRYADMIARFRSRRLLKRACVYPLYANREVQDQLVARFFAPGQHAERSRVESALTAALAAEGIAPPPVLLYCPARKMQLKEAATHLRLPGSPILPMSRFGDRIPRLADLERAYRDLWKLYVLAGTEDGAVLDAIARVMAELVPEAVNVYRPRGR
jgi:HD superfamily phosphohydrolase